METTARPHCHALVRFGATHPEALVLSADLTASCEADGFRDAYPDRFFSFGLGEQNMMGFAAGLAREGFAPFVHTFGVFVTRRPFDQVAMSIAYPCLPVRLLGFLPGVTTPGGATHQAIDDLALMRALPNLTVLECGDATEVESLLEAMHAVPGPVYARVLRGEVPRLFPAAAPLVVGHARVLGAGADVTLLSSGICTEEALRAAAALRRRGVGVRHLHVATLKPFDDPAVRDAVLAPGRGVITVENHSIIGGLGSATAELMAELGCGRPLVRLGLRDTFSHGASRATLLREHGMDAAAVVGAVERLLGRAFEVAAAELAAVPLGPGAAAAAAEAL
ncbi:MAG TPA: transketolase C-terminal domain-containing protein [Polyangia bacterium]|jgi:transketolase